MVGTPAQGDDASDSRTSLSNCECCDEEIWDSVNRLGDEAPHYLLCQRQHILNALEQFKDDIACLTCISDVKNIVLDESNLIHEHGPPAQIFLELIPHEQSTGGRNIIILRKELHDLDAITKVFGRHNCTKKFTRSRKGGQRRRCHLHSMKSEGHDWEALWDEMSLEEKQEIALLCTSEIRTCLEKHLQTLRMCSDCSENVRQALAVLVGRIEPTEEEDFNKEYFAPFERIGQSDAENKGGTFIITVKESQLRRISDMQSSIQNEGSTCTGEQESADNNQEECCMHRLGCSTLRTDIEAVLELIWSAEDADRVEKERLERGESGERHAPNLKDAQIELLCCIGKLLRSRIQFVWTEKVRKVQAIELLTWLALSCIRRNLHEALQNRNEQELFGLLDEENLAKQKKHERSTKKRQKKLRKKLVSMDAKQELEGQPVDSSLECQDNLSQPCAEDIDGGLTAVEIQEAKLKLRQREQEMSRSELRAKLRMQFDQLCTRRCSCYPLRAGSLVSRRPII